MNWQGIAQIIEVIHNVTWPYIGASQTTGYAIISFLLALELLSQAFDLATGRGFKLDKILVTCLFAAAFVTLYPQLANGVWSAATSMGKECINGFSDIKQNILDQQKSAAQAMAIQSASYGIFGAIKALPFMIMFGMGIIVMMLALLVIYVMLAGAFASLAFVLVLGPIFISFFLHPVTRGLFMNWVGATISFLLTIPMLGWAIAITVNIFFKSANTAMLSFTGSQGPSQLLTLLVGPITCIGIAFHVPKIAQSLIGGSGGSGGDAAAVSQSGAMMAMRGAGGGASAAASGGVAAAGGGAAGGGANIIAVKG
jgi:type IV secretory pathway VirB6-like protein